MRHCCFQFHSGRSGISDERVQKVENTDGAFGGGRGSDLCGRYAILLGKRKQEGAYQNMSQAKVDRYKEEKKNRKKRTHSKSGSRFIKVMILM